ncbi:MAG: alanine--tRNA ligase [Phycisphaerae bacterium]|nr:alanine--tRNA ligase [Phycisphaerae bacterium]
MTANEIRQQFLEFFEAKGHTIVPSAPVVPMDDPTLMFTNAGMNQFKDVFLGTGSRPYQRAVDTQKCIRVSGKHNDLEEVGRDTYHHTFFEMLGNWSFGDYFKAEGIAWGWELLTTVWKLPAEKLYGTYFGGDEALGLEPDTEAEALWKQVTGLPAERILPGSKNDNFWEMGEVGPCGPCSEVHIDLGEGTCARTHGGPCGVNVEDEGGKCSRFFELWNYVFIQFNRSADGKLTPLPAKHVDTGLGFERICNVLQNAGSNYDTDVFRPLMDHIASLTGSTYTSKLDSEVDVAFRVVADHVRMVSFAIADGATPSNEGRGYVLRRLLRRAARFGRQQLGMDQPFIFKLVPTLADHMGHAFPELKANPKRIMAIVEDEEASFGRTLDRGIQLFSEAAKRAKKAGGVIGGEDAFKLKDTYGFPYDLTVMMATEQGMHVDDKRFSELEAEARQRARAAAKSHAAIAFDGELPKTDDSGKYAGRSVTARILGWVKNNALITSGTLTPGDAEVGLVLDKTCFYAEAGGQVGDAGTITAPRGTFDVDDTRKLGDGIVHVGHVGDGSIEAGQEVELTVDPARDNTRRHHTATHLLHWALREVLGDHVFQRGSLVAPDRLRFDFDHNKACTHEELAEIERLVNEHVYADHVVAAREMPIDEGKKLGAMALFGEKYGDVVRVVSINPPGEDKLVGALSNEFCGGTHLERTGQIGPFKITGEEAAEKGVRRVYAVAGSAAVGYIQSMDLSLRSAAAALNAPADQLAERIAGLQGQIKDLQRQLRKGAAADLKSKRADLLDSAEKAGETSVIVAEVPDAPAEQLREMIDVLREKAGSAAVLLASPGESGCLLLAGLTDDLIKKGLKAGDWVKATAQIMGGGGGGKPNMAQGSGKDVSKLAEALAEAKTWAKGKLG